MGITRKQLNTFAVTVLFLVTIFLGAFSYSHTQEMNHGNMSTNDCPYSIGKYSVCPMGLEFSTLIKALSSVVTTSTFVFILFAFIALWLERKILPVVLVSETRKRSMLSPPIELLFAEGILNPKAP